MKVMIVDDEQHMTEYLKHLIDWREYGFDQVITINKGKEAQQLLEEAPPDLLIADIRLPEVSGLDLAAQLVAQEAPTKVMIVSGYSEFDYAQKAIRCGVTEYLVKPVLKKDFLKALERTLPLMPGRTISTSEADFKSAVTSSPFSSEGFPCEGESAAEDENIVFLKEYIHRHYDEALSLESLGEKVHLNASYLSHHFKAVTGKNLLSYLTEVRMTKAAELLANSDLKVNIIGDMVGYHKTQYFISLFKKKYGLTPQQYRRQQHLRK